MQHERLSQELIVEAILEVRAADDRPLPVEALHAFVHALEGYPRVEVPGRRREDGEEKGAGEETEGEAERSAEGYVAFAEDSKSAVQARPAGFFYNRLKPYPGWDAFKAEARGLWEAFSHSVPDFRPATIGLRYINQLELEVDRTGDRRIFRAWPWPPDSVLTRKASRYYMRIDAPTQEEGVDADVTHVLEVAEDGKTVRIVIENGVRAEAPGDTDDTWDRFEDLHEVAYRLFRDTFTDETYERLR